MKKLYSDLILVILFILCLTGCKSCTSFKLQEEIKLVAADHKISQSDFEKLLKGLKDSGNENFKIYENPQKLYDYILKALAAENISAEVWNPNPIAVLQPYNVNVFLENSESIDGYVRGTTDFKNSIYDMLANIKMNTMCKMLNLNYINEGIPFTKKDAVSHDIQDFIKKLNTAAFKAKGGNRTSSDLAAVIDTVLGRTNDENLSVLISDFVFSPGRGENALDYLKSQSVSIRSSISEKLKQEHLAIAIYQMVSGFDGVYFNQFDHKTPIKGQRPYYIWIIGSEIQVKSLLESQVINSSDNSLQNNVVFKSTQSPEEVPYKITRNDLIGNFMNGENRTEMKNIKPVSGKFRFSIAVNFANNLQGDSYFNDPKNYNVSGDYRLTTRLLTVKEKDSPALSGFTHLLTLETDKFNNQSFDISIISKSPSWVESYTSLDDTNILDKGEQKRTFGLKYLIDGVSDAFNGSPAKRESIISKISIKIKQ